MTICNKAETKAAALYVDSVASKEQSGAVSCRASFEQIGKLADLSAPLRRPARCQPSRDIEDYLDVEAAKAAMKDEDRLTAYEEFRLEIGLSD